MTVPVVVDTPIKDERVLVAVEHLAYALKHLDKPLTVARIHAIKGHVAGAIGLLTPPLRPEEVE